MRPSAGAQGAQNMGKEGRRERDCAGAPWWTMEKVEEMHKSVTGKGGANSTVRSEAPVPRLGMGLQLTYRREGLLPGPVSLRAT